MTTHTHTPKKKKIHHGNNTSTTTMNKNPQKIKEKFTSKPTENQTHYHREALEIKLKTHPEFTHHREAHDVGLTRPHANLHADFQPSFGGMLKRRR